MVRGKPGRPRINQQRDERLCAYVAAHPTMAYSAVARVFHLNSPQHVFEILKASRHRQHCETCYHRIVICSCREVGDIERRPGQCSDWTPTNGQKEPPCAE